MSLSLNRRRKEETESSLPVNSGWEESFWAVGLRAECIGKRVYCLSKLGSVKKGEMKGKKKKYGEW